MAHPVGTITQPRAYSPLSGRRYGSFAGRAEFFVIDDNSASLFTPPEQIVATHLFPQTSSSVGHRHHHHGFSLLPLLFPRLSFAGV